MAKTLELFDLKPFTRKDPRRFGRRYRALGPEVKAALRSLRQTIRAVPPAEMARRRKLFESTYRAGHRG